MRFAKSERSTLGVEWELALVDLETRELAPRGPELLASVGDERLVGEFLTNTIELVTGVHRSAASAIAELDELRGRVVEASDALGAAPIGSGTHPFSPWREQACRPVERYRRVIERSGQWGAQLAIWGVHTHIGVESTEKVAPIINGVLADYPLIHALAGSSPFWEGEDTTFSSHRSMLFQQLPTGGLPPELTTWRDYERVAHDLLHTGIVEELGELRWDVRPAGRLGTVELRIADGATRIDDLAAIVALSHCMVEHCSRELDAGRRPGHLPQWFVRENKWRAGRYGLDAIIIVDEGGDERLVTDVLRDRVRDWMPIARDLGCEAELDGVLALLDRGTSAQRQREAAARNGGDLAAVVDHLIDELRLDTATAALA